MLIDTHCHLDDIRYDDDLEEVIERAKAAGVKRFIIPGADPDTLEKALGLSESFSEIYFAAGVHPYDIDKYERRFLERFLTHPKCVAVGECGLDYYRLPEEEDRKAEIKKVQKEVFIDQVMLAEKYDKPLIVHIREAGADAYEILSDYASQRGGVLHCFNADENLLKLAQKNFYFGIGGVLTFKNAKKLPQVLLKIPIERLVFETDAPYLTPHPHRGKRNEPAYTALVRDKVSMLLRMPIEEIDRISTQNAMKLFTLA